MPVEFPLIVFIVAFMLRIFFSRAYHVSIAVCPVKLNASMVSPNVDGFLSTLYLNRISYI